MTTTELAPTYVCWFPSCVGDGPDGVGCLAAGVIAEVVLPPSPLGFFAESVEVGPFCLACFARFFW